MKHLAAAGLAGALALMALPAYAQTIYPLNRAEILTGAKFDLKVEFPGAPEQAAVKVTINGQEAASVLGKTSAFVSREDGGDYSAIGFAVNGHLYGPYSLKESLLTVGVAADHYAEKVQSGKFPPPNASWAPSSTRGNSFAAKPAPEQ